MRTSPLRGRLATVEDMIVTLRGQRVILSSSLARLYGVEPRALNQAVRRNAARFPPDFAFRVSRREAADLHHSRSQSVILKRGANLKYPPLAFTEHGAIMAATVLNSERAVQMSIFVVRAFLKLREWVADQAALAVKLAELERRFGEHDHELHAIVETLRSLLEPPDEHPRPRIGFGARDT